MSEIYQNVKNGFKKDRKTGLLLKRVKVKLTQSREEALIIFSKGYHEPEIDCVAAHKKNKRT